MWVSSSVWVSPIHSKLKFCNVFENALWALDNSKQISLFIIIILYKNDKNIFNIYEYNIYDYFIEMMKIYLISMNIIWSNEVIFKKNKIKIY